MPTSNETRVRVDGFSKIMPRILPGRLGVGWPAARAALSAAARPSTSRSSAAVRSETMRRSRFFMLPPPAPASGPGPRRGGRARRQHALEDAERLVEVIAAHGERRHEADDVGAGDR